MKGKEITLKQAREMALKTMRYAEQQRFECAHDVPCGDMDDANARIRELEQSNECLRIGIKHRAMGQLRAEAERDAAMEECYTNWHEYGTTAEAGRKSIDHAIAARLKDR